MTRLTDRELAKRRDGRRVAQAARAASVNYQNALQVMTVHQTATLDNISPVTLLRMIRAGKGPRTIRLSTRRIGIRVCDYQAWQESRMREE